LRLWLIQAGISYKERKKRPHRQWRQRKQCYGEMEQLDGSEHNWFEDRGPKCVLMGYIDDATSRPFGKFYTYEGTIPAMDSFKAYIKKFGIPQSVYLDKHSTYKSTKKHSTEDELNNIEPLSQFGRALKELGVNVIHANSPQAKGRIERLFNTFQDRLIKEMRLKGIKTINEANKFLSWYLPIYTKRFAVKPKSDSDMHRPIPDGINLDRILCKKTEHVLRNDFTIAHNKKLYQIENNIRTQKVIVEERIDGSMLIWHKNMLLKFKEITVRPEKIIQPKLPRPYVFFNKAHMPAADHPWRRYGINSHINSYSQKEKVGQKEKELLLTTI